MVLSVSSSSTPLSPEVSSVKKELPILPTELILRIIKYVSDVPTIKRIAAAVLPSPTSFSLDQKQQIIQACRNHPLLVLSKRVELIFRIYTLTGDSSDSPNPLWRLPKVERVCLRFPESHQGKNVMQINPSACCLMATDEEMRGRFSGYYGGIPYSLTFSQAAECLRNQFEKVIKSNKIKDVCKALLEALKLEYQDIFLFFLKCYIKNAWDRQECLPQFLKGLFEAILDDFKDEHTKEGIQIWTSALNLLEEVGLVPGKDIFLDRRSLCSFIESCNTDWHQWMLLHAEKYLYKQIKDRSKYVKDFFIKKYIFYSPKECLKERLATLSEQLLKEYWWDYINIFLQKEEIAVEDRLTNFQIFLESKHVTNLPLENKLKLIDDMLTYWDRLYSYSWYKNLLKDQHLFMQILFRYSGLKNIPFSIIAKLISNKCWDIDFRKRTMKLIMQSPIPISFSINECIQIIKGISFIKIKNLIFLSFQCGKIKLGFSLVFSFFWCLFTLPFVFLIQELYRLVKNLFSLHSR